MQGRYLRHVRHGSRSPVQPDHRDQCMSSSEKKANDQIAACVSRAKSSRLVLELF